MAEYWQTLAPLPQTALDTIRDGAYYTLLIQDKLRVLSFNSDYGYIGIVRSGGVYAYSQELITSEVPDTVNGRMFNPELCNTQID